MKTLIMGVCGTGTNILKALATRPNWTRLAVNTDIESLEQQLGLQVLLVAVLPFIFEGRHYERAAGILKKLKPASTPLRIFEDESLLQIDQPLSLNEAFVQMKQRIENDLKSILAQSRPTPPNTVTRRQIVLDTETTGIDPRDGHRIIEIGCVELIDGKRTGDNRHWFLNPECDIDQGAQDVHGLTWEFLADKPTFADIADDLLRYIKGTELIAHNAHFDMSFLNAELARLGHEASVESLCDILDTLPIAKRLNPNQKCSLDALCERYSVDNSNRQQHGALLDAELLTDVYLNMLETNG